MILRIIDLEGNFLRDDFTCDEEKEIGLNVNPAQGLYKPKWSFDDKEWFESGTKPEPQPQSPSEQERLNILEDMILLLMTE